MNQFVAASLLTMMVSASCWARGGGVIGGNGGDTVECRPQAEAEFVGLFTLDYLAEFKRSGQQAELVEGLSWEESRRRIESVLRRVAPELVPSFQDFGRQVLRSSSVESRSWEPTDLTDVDIKDEDISRLLPVNCYVQKDLGLYPNLRQTVVRFYESDRIVYRYDEPILGYQLKNAPLQFSFFMVHEWLWDFTTNIRALRRLNWLLHSKFVDDIGPEYLANFFSVYDFFDRQLSVCNRSKIVREALRSGLGMSCEDVSDKDLLKLKRLDLSQARSIRSIRSGDLGGLFFLESLDLSGNEELFRFLPPYSFRHLGGLKTLDISGTRTEVIPEWVVHQLKGMEELNISGNPIKALDSTMRAFSSLKRLTMSFSDDFDFLSLRMLKYGVELQVRGGCPAGLLEKLRANTRGVKIAGDCK